MKLPTIRLPKRKPDMHEAVVHQYAKDLEKYTVLRDRVDGDERGRYSYVIEVMQRTLIELIDRNKE